MISQTAEYALRAMVMLADREGIPQTAQAVSEVTQVPVGYLSKIMLGLVKAGLVTSRRGLHGGFVLSSTAAKLTIYDVVEAVDPIRRITTCPLSLAAHGKKLCSLHRRLDDALATTETAFRAVTLQQLLTQTGNSRPLCPLLPSSG
ncbi:transcriptional regulator [Planctomycetota bacterium]|nr:transcriptional regulator [Planctomycetota bacterium]